MNEKALIDKALEARDASYSPYSGFSVGAALLLSNGDVFLGTNVENASYGCTVCAERVAMCAALSQKRRDFCAIAIVGGHKDKDISEFCPPCGICRQFMAEFCPPDFKIILYNGEVSSVTDLSSLLPKAFEL